MTSYIFIILAAFFNAVMDVLLWHFDKSIFSKYNAKWWNPSISWQYVKLTFNWMRFDAWHIAKTAMLLSLFAAVHFYTPVFGWLDIFIMWFVWGVVFESFYKYALRHGSANKWCRYQWSACNFNLLGIQPPDCIGFSNVLHHSQRTRYDIREHTKV